MTPGEVKRMDRKKCLIFMEGQYPIMDWKNLPFDTAVWKESKRLAGKTGYKHPVRVVYNPKTMTYRTIRNKQDFQVLDKKDVEFYKEAEKTDRSIKVCEINEEDFLYLNFDTNPTPTEEELIQMFEQWKNNQHKTIFPLYRISVQKELLRKSKRMNGICPEQSISVFSGMQSDLRKIN